MHYFEGRGKNNMEFFVCRLCGIRVNLQELTQMINAAGRGMIV